MCAGGSRDPTNSKKHFSCQFCIPNSPKQQKQKQLVKPISAQKEETHPTQDKIQWQVSNAYIGTKMAPPKSLEKRLAAYKERVLKVDGSQTDLSLLPKSTPGQKRPRAFKSAPRADGKRAKSNHGQRPPSHGKGSSGIKRPADPSTQYLTKPLTAPIVGEAKRFMTSTGKLESFNIHLGATKSWRTSAKLSVRGNPPVIGLFAPKSHKVVAMHSSLVHHPSINRATSMLARAIKELDVQGYNGKDPGGLSYVAFNVEIESSKVQLSLVFNNEHTAELSDKVAKLDKFIRKTDPNLLHSVWLHCHPCSKHDNSIFSHSPDAWHHVSGERFIRDCLSDLISVPMRGGGKKRDASGKKRRKRDLIAAVEASKVAAKESGAIRPVLYFPPFVFRQANIRAFTKIIANLKPFLPNNAHAVELYGGVGTIGLNVLDKLSSLSCSDENPHNKVCFEKTVSELPPEAVKHVEYVSSPAAKVAKVGGLANAQVLIVDPPRKGLDDEVIDAISVSEAPKLKTIVYVSCGFNAFKTDCTKIMESGFKLIHGEGHVLFPGSNHIETLAVFQRE